MYIYVAICGGCPWRQAESDNPCRWAPKFCHQKRKAYTPMNFSEWSLISPLSVTYLTTLSYLSHYSQLPISPLSVTYLTTLSYLSHHSVTYLTTVSYLSHHSQLPISPLSVTYLTTVSYLSHHCQLPISLLSYLSYCCVRFVSHTVYRYYISQHCGIYIPHQAGPSNQEKTIKDRMRHPPSKKIIKKKKTIESIAGIEMSTTEEQKPTK